MSDSAVGHCTTTIRVREIQKCMKFAWLPSVDMIGASEDYTRCVIEKLEGRLEWGRKNDNQLVVDDAIDKIKKAKVHLKTLEAEPPKRTDLPGVHGLSLWVGVY